jgi:hypothetical protein
MECRLCEIGTLNRRSRQGFVERYLLRWLGLFPWRCSNCERNYYLFRRNE